MIRVVVIDRSTVTRFGLFALLTRQPDIRFVEDTGSTAKGAQLVDAHRPDVVTVDMGFPDGLDLARLLRERYPRLGIVLLTSADEQDALFKALESGASAFVARNAQTDEVLAAVRHAAVATTSFTATGLAAALARRAQQRATTALSRRELEVLRHLSAGLSVQAIARAMFVSPSTAKTYVGRLYEKLGATNRAQAIMTASRQGLISDTDCAIGP